MIRRSHPSPNAIFLITQVAASRTSHYRLYINTNIYILKVITAAYYEITRLQVSQSNGNFFFLILFAFLYFRFSFTTRFQFF